MRIGELAQRVGVTTKSIRFYESIGLMPDPGRTASGYRIYAEVDVERLGFIKTAQRLGLTLDEVREILALRERGEQPCRYVADVLRRQVEGLDRRIRDMRRLRDELQSLQAAATVSADGGRVCGIIEHANHETRAI